MARSPIQFIDAKVPLYKRWMPTKQRNSFKYIHRTKYIRLTGIVLDDFGENDPVAKANDLFEDRLLAGVITTTAKDDGIMVSAEGPGSRNLLSKYFDGSKYEIICLNNKSLAVMVFNDFFPFDQNFRDTVSSAIMAATEGYAGTFGRAVDTDLEIKQNEREGNYDMTQMHLIPVAYRYYNELRAPARERLIKILLAGTHIQRPHLDSLNTSGGVPDDYYLAGRAQVPVFHHLPFVGKKLIKNIGETENHIFTIHTARYLTNQLLFQDDHDERNHDNRRNGFSNGGNMSCTDLMLQLLQRVLMGDFSEYNSKNYQVETRSAILNLCTYAYDDEVRLAARMVLDYMAARFASSSCDLRRLMPFRRLNTGVNSAQFGDGLMNTGLVDNELGADPMAAHYAIQSGLTRPYSTANLHPLPGDNLPIRPDPLLIYEDGRGPVQAALSDYRIPPSIHDLLLNDRHRRFYQRLHRRPIGDAHITGLNCENLEMYAGSASFLISAGGSPATYAINPQLFDVYIPSGQDKQLGVAVTTTFMPTNSPGLVLGDTTLASHLIQFSHFSQLPFKVFNYGVAPDFACGYKLYLPPWCVNSIDEKVGKFSFINKKHRDGFPGFYLAIFQDGDFALLEAFDTWMPGSLDFDVFKRNVLSRNQHLLQNGIQNDVGQVYVTEIGNTIHFKIYSNIISVGASIEKIDWSPRDTACNIGDISEENDWFNHGSVLDGEGNGLVRITNRALGTEIVLDMREKWNPKRTSETGELKIAGLNYEVWVKFDWTGDIEGDFYRPFNTLSGAIAGVAAGGTIKIMPGKTKERPVFLPHKKYRIVAPIGGVTMCM